MKRIGLISDTHGYLDPRVSEHFKDCNEIWHAGDFGEGVAKELELLKPLRGVWGNIDGQQERIQFREELFFEIENVKVLMIHIGGSPGKYYPRALQFIQKYKPDLFVCGHSHILKVMHDKTHSMLYMNPGAAGKHGFHKIRTVLRFEIHEAKIENMEAIELGHRALPA